MQVYWGDLHNHCDITYGYGSQANALARAADHLDFCAITGHAMWPDIVERNEETAFIIDFHQEGFKKLRDHWDEVRREIAAANGPDFVTFQAYEMHSGQYGDHHIVSPDDQLPLIYRNSPGELKRDAGVPAITIVHHIGYPPSYRGIDWDLFDERVTPLVEVCSKHGCAMSETAPFPYYHDMGPRDSRNTVYEGLKRGLHFGFVGSTDHHAGYPGSYGDGKLAALAEAKTRESIWEAFLNRRTYAVTGDRIRCNFTVNGALMGSILPPSKKREICWNVEACYPINKIVLYRNLKPVQVVCGESLLPLSQKSGKYKLRIETGWGNNEEEAYEWQCSVQVTDGKIIGAEPCFRGRSVLSPKDTDTSGRDKVNDLPNRILSLTPDSCSWQCFTFKNMTTLHPQTCAVILEVEGDPSTQVSVDINGRRETRTIAQLLGAGYAGEMKKWHSQAFKVHTAVPACRYQVSGSFSDTAGEGQKEDFYHLEVSQLNGHWAFVTPVWVKC